MGIEFLAETRIGFERLFVAKQLTILYVYVPSLAAFMATSKQWVRSVLGFLRKPVLS